MVVQLRTSFLSKTPQSISAGGGGGRRSTRLFPIVAVGLFIIVALLAGAVFFYRGYLIRSISEMDSKLAAAKNVFEPEFINEAGRLHSRIEAAKGLFAAHSAPSLIFDLLEKKTLETVRFLDFSYDARNERETTLSMQGEARSFNAVALQSDVFGADPLFVNPIFSDFSLNEQGDVVFHFKTNLDTARLRYRETVISSGAAEEEAAAHNPAAPAGANE